MQTRSLEFPPEQRRTHVEGNGKERRQRCPVPPPGRMDWGAIASFKVHSCYGQRNEGIWKTLNILNAVKIIRDAWKG